MWRVFQFRPRRRDHTRLVSRTWLLWIFLLEGEGKLGDCFICSEMGWNARLYHTDGSCRRGWVAISFWFFKRFVFRLDERRRKHPMRLPGPLAGPSHLQVTWSHGLQSYCLYLYRYPCHRPRHFPPFPARNKPKLVRGTFRPIYIYNKLYSSYSPRESTRYIPCLFSKRPDRNRA